MDVQEFDPLKHKRGAHGKFTDMLRSLRPGSAVKLPDGHQVKVSNERYGAGRRRMYTVHGPNGEKLGNNHLEAQTASIMALNKSAQHEHPDAVGGKKRHESFAAAMDYANNGTQEAPIRNAEQAAGSAHDRLGANAAEIRRTLHSNPRIAMKQLAKQNIPQFQKRAILAHLKAEQRNAGLDARRGAGAENPADFARGVSRADLEARLAKTNDPREKELIKAALELKKGGAAKGENRAGDPNKPKASDLTPGVTKLTHSQHGEMVYMGRNATNHHVARKASEPDGKKHIIRLKEITIGHKGTQGSQQSMGADKAEGRNPAAVRNHKADIEMQREAKRQAEAAKPASDDLMKRRAARYKELAKLPRDEINAKAKQVARVVDVSGPKADVITHIIDAELPVPKRKANPDPKFPGRGAETVAQKAERLRQAKHGDVKSPAEGKPKPAGKGKKATLGGVRGVLASAGFRPTKSYATRIKGYHNVDSGFEVQPGSNGDIHIVHVIGPIMNAERHKAAQESKLEGMQKALQDAGMEVTRDGYTLKVKGHPEHHRQMADKLAEAQRDFDFSGREIARMREAQKRHKYDSPPYKMYTRDIQKEYNRRLKAEERLRKYKSAVKGDS